MSPRTLPMLIACGIIAAAGCTSATDGQPRAATADTPTVLSVPTLLILDGSGSMTTADAPGPRMAAAKTAALGLIAALPNDAVIGLQTYGTTVGSAEADKPAGCRDVTSLLPLERLSRTAMTASIEGIVPSGYTPISLALQTATDQLPTDGEPQAVVLVSDGEDTCDTPPCDTATRLKQQHPGLAISTVGFKVDGAAADQLRCIADATGGLFVQAANSAQLAARLLATQNTAQANQSLSDKGLAGIELGMGLDDIRAKHADFPDAARTGTVRVIWRDCDFDFVEGVLDGIGPHDGGRTIDGVTVGTSAARAGELYGAPLKADGGDANGVSEVVFDANPSGGNAYRMGIKEYVNDGGKLSGTVKTIVLCRCKPKAGVSGQAPAPEQVVVKPVDSQGNTQSGFLKDDSERDTPIDCSDGYRSSFTVADGVRDCGMVPDAGYACWPTAGGAYVLCLSDPFKNVLRLRAATGGSSQLQPPFGPPRPLGLELDDGSQCTAHTGGAWPSQEQNQSYVGYYSCDNHGSSDSSAIWAPADTADGVVKGPDGWIVEVGDFTGPLTPHKVTKAYYVGVA